MSNRYGLDTDYFSKKMQRIIRDIENYKPNELARELARMSKTADEKVLREDEFLALPWQIKDQPPETDTDTDRLCYYCGTDGCDCDML